MTKQYNIIQVGAHDDGVWNWGIADTPRNLSIKGYKYFKYSSFLPCTIFRYSYFCQFIKQAYDGIHYYYPHMPCFLKAYTDDITIYISKQRIVTATVGVQSYSFYIPLRGFAILTSFLSDKKDKRQLLEGAFPDKIERFILKVILHGSIPSDYEGNMVLYRLFSVCSIKEKMIVVLCLLPILSKQSFKTVLRTLTNNVIFVSN